MSAARLAAEFGLSAATAKKYLRMTEEDIQALDRPRSNNWSAKRAMDGYVNIVYKMMRDGIDDETICHYVRRKGFGGDLRTIWDCVQSIGDRNFPGRKKAVPKWLLRRTYPSDVAVIRRAALLKYILTVNPKTKKDKTIGEHIDIIKAKFPAVEMVQTMFLSFHSVLMGGDADALDGFMDSYGESEIAGFCNGIKKDIAPVRNAITMEESSGFVEGCNNKFKFIKRAMYGRSKLPHLTQKCRLAFAAKRQGFNLFDLI
jgi:hypothetical protein